MSVKKQGKVGIAIIGMGLIGQKRADAVVQLSNAKLISIFDINKKVSKNLAAIYSCSSAQSMEEVLNNSDVDLVILAIQHKAAARLAPIILQSKHLLMEKPIGRNLAETKQIIDAAKNAKYKLFGGFNYRFYPHVALLTSYIKEKRLGKVISSSFTLGHAAYPGYEKTWKMDKNLCGGGVIIDPGIHMIDLMIEWFGAPNTFQFQTNKIGWKSRVEDEAYILFSYPNMSISQHHYSLNLAKNTLSIEIVGQKGTVRINGRGGNYGDMTFEFVPRWFWQDKRKKIITKNFRAVETTFRDELMTVLTMVQNNKNQQGSYDRYIACMEMIDKIYSQKVI